MGRTYEQWKAGAFADGDPAQQATCGDCHTKVRTGTAADVPGAPLRPQIHDHAMFGLRSVQTTPDTALLPQLCVQVEGGSPAITAHLKTLSSGHDWPGGATQNRRIWVEVIAYDGDGKVIYSTGVVGDDERLVDIDDPDLWRLGDQTFNADDEPEHRIWEITRVEPNPPGTRTWLLDELPDRVTLNLHIRTVGRDVIDDLIQTGYITEKDGETHKSKIATLTVNFTPAIDWRAEDGVACFPDI